VIDYDREAASYDDTRGGPERAAAVAAAVEPLLGPARAALSPDGAGPGSRGTGLGSGRAGLGSGRTLLDVACGTGIVTALLSSGRAVVGVDRSVGMLSVAATRLGGRVLRGDATRLPVASASVDAVLMVWLLHLLDDATAALEEAVRVVKPGGRVITTVDKGAAYFAVPSDLASATSPWRDGGEATDAFERVAESLARHGLRPVGEGAFPGIGQGRSPRRWREAVRAGRVPWARSDPDGVDRALAGLPGQDLVRPEPRYRIAAFG
jgi:SAM-dependent methyltransferase